MNLNQSEHQLVIEALSKRQRSFVAGDKMYREYGKLIDTFKTNMNEK
jgi:hypothetical protein